MPLLARLASVESRAIHQGIVAVWKAVHRFGKTTEEY